MADFDFYSIEYGPWIGGLAFAMFLYGITCAQTMYYFWHYARDRLWLRSLVAMLWTFDTMIALFEVAILFFSFIYSDLYFLPFNYLDFNMIGISFSVEFILTSIVVIIVHSYYVYAIWTTSARTWYHKPLTVVLLLFAIGSFVAGLINAAFAIRDGGETIPGYGIPNPTAESYNQNLSTIPPITQMVLASITDIGITVTLCSSTVGHKHSLLQADPIVMKLTLYLIERGILTTAIQLLQMATYVYAYFGIYAFGYPYYLWIAFQFVGSKIYVNSFLALLNARNHISEAGEVHELRLRQVKTDICFPADSSLGVHTGHKTRANSEYHRCDDVHSSRSAAEVFYG